MNFKDEFLTIKDKYNGWNRYSSVSKHILVGSLAVASLFGAMAATTYENEANTKTHINDIAHSPSHRLTTLELIELESNQANIDYNNSNIAKELGAASISLALASMTVAIGETRRNNSQ